MNNVGKRLLVFFIGLPLIIGFVLLEPFNHLCLNLLVIACAIAGSMEFYRMLSPRYKLLPKPAIVILTTLLPIYSYVAILLGLDFNTVSWIFVFELIILMGIECFSEKEFSESITKLGLSSFIIFYPGFLLTFITKLSAIENYSTQYIILFLLLVFICDSLAWFFGVLFGKSTRGYIAVSPNKSLVGFAGGLLGSLLSGLAMKYFFPDAFPGGWWKIILMSICCGLSTIVGDLIESVFKRSCQVKDSGRLIPGRGGLLDSIDSIVATAPVYYVLLYFLYLA